MPCSTSGVERRRRWTAEPNFVLVACLYQVIGVPGLHNLHRSKGIDPPGLFLVLKMAPKSFSRFSVAMAPLTPRILNTWTLKLPIKMGYHRGSNPFLREF